jgi:hypothetical protein
MTGFGHGGGGSGAVRSATRCFPHAGFIPGCPASTTKLARVETAAPAVLTLSSTR